MGVLVRGTWGRRVMETLVRGTWGKKGHRSTGVRNMGKEESWEYW